MAKIEYSATCLCGGKIVLTLKKPTRFQPSIKRAKCQGCGSEFMFTFSVEYANGQRAYVPEHEMINTTAKLWAVIEAKREQLKETAAG
jgi:hypothetical protein